MPAQSERHRHGESSGLSAGAADLSQAGSQREVEAAGNALNPQAVLQALWSCPGRESVPVPEHDKLEYDSEAVQIFGEQLYWEDYWDRNGGRPRLET